MGKYTQIPTDTFEKLQMNAGIICTTFDPSTATASGQIAATTGGISFSATPSFLDFGDDIDNCPKNTMELKRVDDVEVTLTGTMVTVDTQTAKMLMAAADIDGSDATKIVPRKYLKDADFSDLWFIGDFSEVNTGSGAGFIAIKLKNVLSTGGFALQTQDKGKGQFAFTFTGHYSINAQDTVPYEVYIKAGVAPDTTLATLTLGSLTLSPTFNKNTLSYTTTTTDATNTITATATDSVNATVVIKNGTTTVTSGSSATWVTGKNTVTITVTNDGETSVYTVEVTKS